MADVLASLEAASGEVVVKGDGDELAIRQGKSALSLTKEEATNLALAIITPVESWRRSMLWAIFDHQLEAIWNTEADERPAPVLALQRLVSTMDTFRMLGGGEDESVVKRVLDALASMDDVPGLPAIPTYEDDAADEG